MPLHGSGVYVCVKVCTFLVAETNNRVLIKALCVFVCVRVCEALLLVITLTIMYFCIQYLHT